MLLQKMIYKEDNFMEAVEIVCAVNMVQSGGEYTLCGNAIPDTTIKDNGCEHIGNEFIGSLKEITCGDCLRFINFIKNLD